MNADWLKRRTAGRDKPKKGSLEAVGEFISSGRMASYLSVMVSSAALLLASTAYLSWSRQESAKRKADVAMEVLKATYGARLCFTNALPRGLARHWWRAPPDIEAIVSEGVLMGEKCGAQLLSLDSASYLADGVLDAEAGGAVRAAHKEMSFAIERFKALALILEGEKDNPEEAKKSERINKNVKDLTLKQLGYVEAMPSYREMSAEEKERLETQREKFSDVAKIKDRVERVEKALRRYISFQ